MCIAVATVGLPILQPHPAEARAFNYPGRSPCNRSLQRCINQVPNGSTIRIRTENQIRSNLDIRKSLTLKAAAGVQPTIGGGQRLRSVEIEERPSGRATKVKIEGISFRKTEVDVSFFEGKNHTFEITDSEFDYPGPDNAEGALEIDFDAPGTASVRRNSFDSTGYAIDLSTSLNGGRAEFNVVGNIITGSSDPDSAAAISFISFDRGTSIANLYSNLIYATSFCNCGGDAAIDLGSIGNGQSRVNLVNNTIDDIPGAGILVREPSSGGALAVALFNNVVSSTEDQGIRIESMSPDLQVPNDYNNFFDLGNENIWSGYTEGPHNISENPLYVNASERNYRLQSGSTLRGRGVICSIGGLPRVDVKGDKRVTSPDTTSDPIDPPDVSMGAFEITAAPPGPGKNLIGTNGIDNLTGTGGNDVICGLGEADELNAGGGNDIVFGGSGNDTITGGVGDDYLSGENDEDDITGGSGSDQLHGGNNNDTLNAVDGVPGNDALNGGAGTDNCQPDPPDEAFVAGC